ncbi:MAG: response regulator [Elusimicrobia bacterium]|nr:response regulator [Elusimicrobiota bacterium]
MKKVLVVDDDQEMAHAIRRVLLNHKTFEVDLAFDGVTACEKAVEFQPDLVLLDVRMPGMDGFEVCSRLKNDPRTASAKVIVVSGALDMEAVAKLIGIGANDYITKPFRNEFLHMMIMRVLGR